MDPTQALDVIRSGIAEMRRTGEEPAADEIGTIINHVEALDEWMTKGGFPPEQWPASLGRPRLRDEGEILEDVEHGKRTSYNKGCRCAPCRASNRLRRNLSVAEIQEMSA